MKRKGLLGAAILALLLMQGGLAAAPVLAAGVTHWVSKSGPATPPGTSCQHPGYNSIQAAVNAATPGDVINVCPGTYTEQVRIETSAKNNLTVRSVAHWAAVIQAPPTIVADPYKSIVRVSQATGVAIRDFTVTGPGPAGCDSIESGVRVDTAGSATVQGNHITQIRDSPFSGCQNGVGIQVGRQFQATTGSATILYNVIDNYQKNGITIDNLGSTATVIGNAVSGVGPTPAIAQNGIQISRGAVARVAYNLVSDNTYSLANLGVYSSTGMLLYQAGPGNVVERNAAQRNDDNLGVYTTAAARLVENRLTNSTFYDGIFMDADTANNQIARNFARGNLMFDCEDVSVGPGTAGTANYWIANDGVTQNRPGLCRPDGGEGGGDGGDGQGRSGGHDGKAQEED